jgi:hypothetical protein
MRRSVYAMAAAVTSVAGPAVAFNPQPEPPAFGMVRLARTQTAILNVVLVPVPEDGQEPCVVHLSFVDAGGAAFRDAAGQEIGKRVELRGNVAASLALRWQDAIPTGQLHAPLRAVATPVPEDGRECRGLVATLEIVDLLGGTRVLYAPTPDDGQPTPDDGRTGTPPAFGMVGIALTQTAILNVVLTPTPDDGQPSCFVDLAFLGAQGAAFRDAAGHEIRRRVELRGHAAAALALRWQEAIPTGQLRAPLRAVAQPVPEDGASSACGGLVATLEIVDLLGATRVLYSPTPDDGLPTPDDGAR